MPITVSSEPQAYANLSLSPDAFKELAREGATLVPLYKEFIADIETPVSALLKLGEGPYRYVLESVEGGDRMGRYSFVGNTASLVFRSRGHTVEIGRPDEAGRFQFTSEEVDDPLDALRRLLADYVPANVPGLPRFYGGAVGYIGYEMVRHFEPVPQAAKDDLDVPESYFILSDTVLIFDHAERKLKVVVNAHLDGSDPDVIYHRAAATIDDVVRRLTRHRPIPSLHGLTEADPLGEPSLTSNFEREQFEDAVRQCQELIRSGELFQVVLSQRFSVPMAAEPFDLYRILRTVNPSPYMYYLQFADMALVGSSPEVMVRVENGIAQLRPIAGTRPRGTSESQDQALAAELLADEKEKAEHVMLVDLGRNDLGRVCLPGSVEVNEFMVVERYSHVMHIVSNVVGQLAPDKDPFDVLRAAFPAGTVSGAPKVRAMQVIASLEPSRRGPYAGAIGYFGFSGNMDSAITIRTVLIKDGVAHVQAGAGIVLDSVPRHEYEETLNKAKAMLKAIAMAQEAAKGAAL